MQAIFIEVNGQMVKLLVWVDMYGSVQCEKALLIDSTAIDVTGIAVATKEGEVE